MRSIPADQLRALRNEVSVRAVIADLRIPVSMRGRRQTFRCPTCAGFHTATKESTNLAHCFRCRRSLNPIDLVIAERKVTFLEAVHHVQALLESR